MRLIKDKRTIRKYLSDVETVKTLTFSYVFTTGSAGFFRAVFIPEKAKKQNIGKYFAFDSTLELYEDYLERYLELKTEHKELLKTSGLAFNYIEEEAAKEVMIKYYLR